MKRSPILRMCVAILLLTCLLPAFSLAEGGGSGRVFENTLTYEAADGSQMVLEFDANAPFKTDSLAALLEQLRLGLEAVDAVANPGEGSMGYELATIPARITCSGQVSPSVQGTEEIDYIVYGEVVKCFEAIFNK